MGDIILEARDLTKSYGPKTALNGLNLSLEKGKIIGLLGPNGSGKSTLAKLLVHYYDLDSGEITIGGNDITHMTLETLNDQVAYVSQEQFLFNTTLYENILIGKPDASREEVMAAEILRTGQVVVSGSSPASTNLELTHALADRLKEWLLVHIPSNGSTREVTPTIVLGKFRGTVSPYAGRKKILSFIVIVNTTEIAKHSLIYPLGRYPLRRICGSVEGRNQVS